MISPTCSPSNSYQSRIHFSSRSASTATGRLGAGARQHQLVDSRPRESSVACHRRPPSGLTATLPSATVTTTGSPMIRGCELGADRLHAAGIGRHDEGTAGILGDFEQSFASHQGHASVFVVEMKRNSVRRAGIDDAAILQQLLVPVALLSDDDLIGAHRGWSTASRPRRRAPTPAATAAAIFTLMKAASCACAGGGCDRARTASSAHTNRN